MSYRLRNKVPNAGAIAFLRGVCWLTSLGILGNGLVWAQAAPRDSADEIAPGQTLPPLAPMTTTPPTPSTVPNPDYSSQPPLTITPAPSSPPPSSIAPQPEITRPVPPQAPASSPEISIPVAPQPSQVPEVPVQPQLSTPTAPQTEPDPDLPPLPSLGQPEAIAPPRSATQPPVPPEANPLPQIDNRFPPPVSQEQAPGGVESHSPSPSCRTIFKDGQLQSAVCEGQATPPAAPEVAAPNVPQLPDLTAPGTLPTPPNLPDPETPAADSEAIATEDDPTSVSEEIQPPAAPPREVVVYRYEKLDLKFEGNGDRTLLFPLLKSAPMTSGFGWRIHPIFQSERFHSGTDFAAPEGALVVAAYSGRVAIADYLSGYGLTVALRHKKDTHESRYAHLSVVHVKPGEWVEQGQVIGRVGNTGFSTGPHLHFEWRRLKGDRWVAVDAGEQLLRAMGRGAFAEVAEGSLPPALLEAADFEEVPASELALNSWMRGSWYALPSVSFLDANTYRKPRSRRPRLALPQVTKTETTTQFPLSVSAKIAAVFNWRIPQLNQEYFSETRPGMERSTLPHPQRPQALEVASSSRVAAVTPPKT